jgi:phenylacetate-CoA ligase
MVSLYTRLVSGLLFPLHERLKGHDTVAVRRHMEETQWWDPERIEALRLERLRGLLEHATQHVPYYREQLGSLGLRPADIRSIADLARLPFLDKSGIRGNLERLKSDQARGLARFNTGGSSGEPLIFFIGSERVTHDVAAKWRATRWWGVDIGDPEVVIWGSPIELGAQDRLRALRDRLLRTRLLPAFEMSEARLDAFLHEIRRTRPRMLFGYPSALAHIAAYAEQRNQVMSDLGIQVAFVTSERLYDDQRERIQRVFGCRVANGYGGRDAGFIAHQCPEGGMHITAEDIIVETVDGDGRPTAVGQAGEIVVTHLSTRDFPFIRYRTGDVGVLTDARCACGRGLPLLQEIQGRTTDFIVARDGTVMHGLALIYILRDLPGVRGFRIIQESVDLIRVQLVFDGVLPESVAATIRQGFAQRLGEGVEVRIEPMDEIPPERSGKHRYVVSKIQGAA